MTTLTKAPLTTEIVLALVVLTAAALALAPAGRSFDPGRQLVAQHCVAGGCGQMPPKV